MIAVRYRSRLGEDAYYRPESLKIRWGDPKVINCHLDYAERMERSF